MFARVNISKLMAPTDLKFSDGRSLFFWAPVYMFMNNNAYDTQVIAPEFIIAGKCCAESQPRKRAGVGARAKVPTESERDACTLGKVIRLHTSYVNDFTCVRATAAAAAASADARQTSIYSIFPGRTYWLRVASIKFCALRAGSTRTVETRQWRRQWRRRRRQRLEH